VWDGATLVHIGTAVADQRIAADGVLVLHPHRRITGPIRFTADQHAGLSMAALLTPGRHY